jgi:hypothetical protein
MNIMLIKYKGFPRIVRELKSIEFEFRLLSDKIKAKFGNSMILEQFSE